MSGPVAIPVALPEFREAVRYWFRLGCISFGGPAGQIAIMHRELVEQKRWISDRHFLDALNFCMLLPGPEAQQLATYLGWRLHGWKGGVAAGALFVLPSAVLLYGLSWLYLAGGHLPVLNGIFHGLAAAVIAVVAEAVIRIGKKALKSPLLVAVAGASFVAIWWLGISFVWILLAAAALGWWGSRAFPSQFPVAGKKAAARDGEELDSPALELPPAPPATLKRSARILAVCLSLWWLPIVAAGLALGWHSTVFRQGLFFSQAAMVTFGGAYAVLPYVSQQAVEHYQWLSHGQMMSGLALAETTPGPLIMVLQFVGFVGGWQHPGALAPWVSATLGALITTWATFLPCFLWVFLGAPLVGHLHQRRALSASLTAITAAVVGVILNLGVVFSVHAFRLGDARISPDWFVIVLAPLAFVALQVWHWPLLRVLGVCAAAGGIWALFGP